MNSTDTPQAKLLDMLDRLTTEHVVTTKLDNGKNHYEKHDALIAQLRTAIASSIGGVGGKSPQERVPLDADALTKYAQIEAAILARYAEVSDKVPGMLPEDTLRAWYVAWATRNPDDDDYLYEYATLAAWVRIIEEKLAPPTIRELVGEDCPECGFAWYDTVLNVVKDQPAHDDKPAVPGFVDTERKVSLTVTYRPDMQGGLMQSFAKCGCCNHVWMGSAGIRALAYDIEQRGRHAEPELNDNDVIQVLK